MTSGLANILKTLSMGRKDEGRLDDRLVGTKETYTVNFLAVIGRKQMRLQGGLNTTVYVADGRDGWEMEVGRRGGWGFFLGGGQGIFLCSCLCSLCL